MSLNTEGGLLEGIRAASGNSPSGLAPRTVVQDQSLMDAVSARAEYVLFVTGQPAREAGMDIGHPDLRLLWSRNEGSVSRFDYDGYSRRWAPLPGSSPDVAGMFGNSPRLTVPVPDLSVPSSPYSIYIGYPTRYVTFSVSTVPDPSAFSNPPTGIVEISLSNGELNFGASDLANLSYAGSQVFYTRQGFFDRSKSTGSFGSLPSSPSAAYKLLLNPIPGPGQSPRVRVGYEPHLTPVPYASEALIQEPPPGSFSFSTDTGRVVFAPQDVALRPGEKVYYDGVTVGSVSIERSSIGPAASGYPASTGSIPGFDPSDTTRYVLFIQTGAGPRYYLSLSFFDPASGLPDAPPAGVALVSQTSGAVYVSPSDQISVPGTVVSLDTYLAMESGVSVQVYRSPANGPGFPVAPDFVERYSVSGQIVQDGISSPLVMLPTVPLVDGSLAFSVEPAPGGGSFTGPLSDGRDPSSPGMGFLMDFDLRQVKFSSRREVSSVLRSSSPTIKLEDRAISPSGFSASRNGSPILPGTDFDFDPNAGLVEFVRPVGESDPRNVIGLSGSVALPSSFSTSVSSFTAGSVGAALLVGSGPNAGAYRITGYVSEYEVVVDRPFAAAGPQTADVRFGGEIVVDRLFADLVSPFRKLVVRRGSSASGPFSTLGPKDFGVVSQTGQINLARPAAPGEVFSVDYVWLDPGDGRATVPRPRTELAAFRIRQEAGVTVPGTGVIKFNPSGKTVSQDWPITLYVDGVTVDPENFLFSAPGTITVPNSLTDETVTINYFVAEATGGNQTFTLSKNPLDLDRPQISAGSSMSVFNGDVTGVVGARSAVLSSAGDLFFASSAVYDPSAGTTSVTFSPVPEVDTGLSSLSACAPLYPGYMVAETALVDLVQKGSVTVSVAGRALYSAGTVLTIDGDPFLAISASYDASSDWTSVTLSARTRKNYIAPIVSRSVRPVLRPGTDFSTSGAAALSRPFTLFLDGPSARRELVRGLDYSVSDGGSIKTSFPIVYGDSLHAFYVARDPQPAGTSFVFNYSAAVAPDRSNGLLGQRLSASYNLLAPDSFFYRVETVLSFLPEVVQSLRSGSSRSSGPNTTSRSSLRSKDQGVPGLFFDEQHYGNVDIVVQRLLKFYNDLINSYEDVLSDVDGRVVGGSSGKFRFDGLSRRVDSYGAVRNDMDDEVKVLDLVSLVSMTPFSFLPVPVYRRMYEPNPLSRIFPTADQRATAALNDSVLPTVDYMKAIGSLGIRSIVSTSTLTSARAVTSFSAASISGADTAVLVPVNGDPATLVPPFAAGQAVFLYRDDGTLFGGPYSVGSVTGSGPATVVVTGVNFPFLTGGMAQDVSDSSDPNNHFYTPGRDIMVDSESGQLLNITLPLPPPFDNGQVPIAGSEIVECGVAFGNSDISPKRIPALDGSTLNDDGRVPLPPVSRTSTSELFLLEAEQAALALICSATLAPDLVTVTMGVAVQYSVGQQVVFLNGPNAGLNRFISVALTPTSFEISQTLAVLDAVGSDLSLSPPHGSLRIILEREKDVLKTTSAADPPAGAILGPVDSEIRAAISAAGGLGRQKVSGFASSLTQDVLTDTFTDLSSVSATDLLLVSDSSCIGLYKILSVGPDTITVDPTPPYASLPAGGPFNYSVLSPWAFVSPSEIRLLSPFLSSTVAFYEATVAWLAAPSLAGVPARQAALFSRRNAVLGFVQGIVQLLTSGDKLYDTRFLWVQQRADRKTGTLTQQVLARKRREEAQASLAEDHLKELIAGRLSL
ncbi:MAG: hypothetical protein BWY99_02001 [Synergistetes bacterium ADurb.BinA166]|nr:MAG: hypothetical protein BWY99_02001 [Synergistetes bacterium ADurb.BinA166]